MESDRRAASPAPPRSAARDGRRLVRLGLFFYAGLAAIAVAWRVGLHGENLLYASPGDAGRGVALLRDAGLGLALAAVAIGASDLLTRYSSAGRELARALGRAVGPLTLRQCLLLAAASGVAEEAFFRGALQPRVGWLLASLLFGLAHFVPRRELALWGAFSLAAGLALGALFELTGNLVAPVTAHVAINAVNLPRIVREFGAGSAP